MLQNMSKKYSYKNRNINKSILFCFVADRLVGDQFQHYCAVVTIGVLHRPDPRSDSFQLCSLWILCAGKQTNAKLSPVE